jgi:hypothetical protein
MALTLRSGARGVSLLTLGLVLGSAGVSGAGSNVWTSNGPPDGEVVSIAVDPQVPCIYAGTWSRSLGLYKSTDAGASWTVRFQSNTYDGGVTAIASDPSNPNILYIGLSRTGIRRAMRALEDWSVSSQIQDWAYESGGLPRDATYGTLHIRGIAIDPLTPSTLYAVVEGQGLFKSTDRGFSWKSSLPHLMIGPMAVNPIHPDTLYATCGSGVFKSTNGGLSWSPSSAGIVGVNFYAIAVAPAAPNTIYAASDQGLFGSMDGAATWRRLTAPAVAASFTALAVDPRNAGIVYAGTYSHGVFRSTDGGGNWASLSQGLPAVADTAGSPFEPITALAVDPRDSTMVYAGTRRGVSVIQIQQQTIRVAPWPTQTDEVVSPTPFAPHPRRPVMRTPPARLDSLARRIPKGVVRR